MSDLARQAVRGTLMVGLANTAAFAVTFGGSLYLMATVSPDDFGIVAFAAALLAICDAMSTWGFSHAAIHRQERVDETFSTFLVLRLAMVGALLVVLIVAATILRGALEGRTRLAVLLALAASVLVDAACNVSAARLSRAMLFGRVAAVHLASVAVATVVAVVLAALGFGVWALVANRLSYSVARAAGLRAVLVEPTRIAFHREDARWLFRFGFPLWLGGLATTWVTRYDDLVVGSMLSSAALGLYDRAYRLALLPVHLVTGVLTRVSFPLYARLQGDRARLSEAFRLVSGTTLRLSAPLAVGMALVIPDFLAFMHWKQWEPMVPMFRWLLVYALARPLMDDAGGLLTAIGRPRITGHTLVAEAIALLVLCPLLTWRWGAAGAAASVSLIVVAAVAAWYASFLPRFVDIAYGQMLLWPLLSLAAGAGAALAVGAWSRLSVGLTGGAAKLAALAGTYVALMLLLDGRQTRTDLRALRQCVFDGRGSDG